MTKTVAFVAAALILVLFVACGDDDDGDATSTDDPTLTLTASAPTGSAEPTGSETVATWTSKRPTCPAKARPVTSS